MMCPGLSRGQTENETITDEQLAATPKCGSNK